MSEKLPTEAMIEAAYRAAKDDGLTGPAKDCRLFIELVLNAALAASPTDAVERVREWAFDKAAVHHRLAHETEGEMQVQHIASSAAYRNLAEEFAALTDTTKGAAHD